MACDAALCEAELGLGAAGECGANATCACPEGFSGLDDWGQYTDCRVNEGVQKGLWIACTVANAILLVLSFFALAYMLYYWDYIVNPVRSRSPFGYTNERSTDLNSSSRNADDQRRGSKITTRSQPVTRRQKRMQRRKRRRELLSFFSMYLFLSFSASCLMYYIPYFFGRYRFDGNPFQDLGIALATSSIFAGLWFFFYIWYMNLPNLQLYGRLFGVDSFLIRHRKFVRNLILLRVAVINVFDFCILFGVYHILGIQDQELRNTLDNVFLVWCGLLIIDFCVFALVLANALRKLFKQLEDLNGNSLSRGVSTTSESDLASFRSALWTIKLLYTAIIFIGPPTAAIFFLTLAVPPMRASIYLSINCCVIAGTVAGTVVLFVFVTRLKGVRDDNSNSSVAVSPSAQTDNFAGPPPSPMGLSVTRSSLPAVSASAL